MFEQELYGDVYESSCHTGEMIFAWCTNIHRISYLNKLNTTF